MRVNSVLSSHFLVLRMVDVKDAGAAFVCPSVSFTRDRLGRYLHLVLFEHSQDLFRPNFPEPADLDDACLALFRDTLGGCRELDDEHFQAIEDLQRIGTVDLTNYPGLIDPTVPRGGPGITKQPAQLAVLWFVGRKLRVDR